MHALLCVIFLLRRGSEAESFWRFTFDGGTEKFMQLSDMGSYRMGRKRVHESEEKARKNEERIIRRNDDTVSFDTATTRN